MRHDQDVAAERFVAIEAPIGALEREIGRHQ
jgi:hypothetical protein